MTEKEQLMLQMYASSRKKKIIIISIILALILFAVLVLSFVVVSSHSFGLIQNEVYIEYGESYIPELKDFVLLDEDITADNTSLESNLSNEEGKDYASIGEYEVNITHQATYSFKGRKLFSRSINKTAIIYVQDTTAPVFSKDNPSEISVMQVKDTTEAEDISKYFVADDLSGVCSIAISDDAVDYQTAGEYTVEVTATDNSNNQATTTCKVIVFAPELSINKKSIELMVGESDNIEITYNGKEKPVIYNSDENVVSIDGDGNIKALLEGKCYLSISCNGITEVCNITVNPKPVEQTTKKETTTSRTSSSNNNSFSSSNNGGSNSQSSNNSKQSYPPKDFLFTDGYTMENVTAAATAYLKESGRAGSCIPLKNDEGIYIGMRVVFDD